MKVKLLNYNRFDGFSSQKRVPGSSNSYDYNKFIHKKSVNVQDEFHSTHLITEDKSKNTDVERPAESINFGGSAVSKTDKEEKSNKVNKALLIGGGIMTTLAAGALFLAHGARKDKVNPNKAFKDLSLAEKLAKSKTFHSIAYYSDDNEAKVKALLALGLAGMLKPVCVLAMPGAKEEDKQFTATKNALSAFIGYMLTCAILNPVSSGVNEFLNNPSKYIKDENNWLIKTLKEDAKKPFNILTPEQVKLGKAQAAKEGKHYYFMDMKTGLKTVYKNGLGIIVAPLKAALTIALMPFILKLLFGDSKGKKKAEEQNQLTPQMEILNNSALTKINMNSNNIDKVFDNFTKGGMRQ